MTLRVLPDESYGTQGRHMPITGVIISSTALMSFYCRVLTSGGARERPMVPGVQLETAAISRPKTPGYGVIAGAFQRAVEDIQ